MHDRIAYNAIVRFLSRIACSTQAYGWDQADYTQFSLFNRAVCVLRLLGKTPPLQQMELQRVF